MFIKEFTVSKRHERYSKLGKAHEYWRTSTMIVLRCDSCDVEFTRNRGKMDPNRINNNYFHVCSNCDSKRFAQKMGDLGNITADNSGTANIKIVAERIDLIGERSIIGRSIVVHSDVDDLGKGGDEESLKTGNAGDRLACGIIVLRGDDND